MTTPSTEDAQAILATQQHRSRLLPDDPTYLRLRDATARRLSASLQRLVRELRGAHQTDQHTALADFITRQTAILQEAYIASYKAGAKDYYGETSMDAGHWAEQTPVNPQRMRQALAFYAPSIAKMAHQALGAVNAAPGMRLDELIAQADNTIRLFSFGRAFGGGRAGPHMGAGDFNAQHERWGNGRFRDMFNHAEHASHHAAVEEHGGGQAHSSKSEEGATAARKIKSPNEKATARVRKVAKAPVEHEAAAHEAERIQNIAVGRIHVGLNPREHFDPEGIHELAASIREHGLLQPITVRPHTQDGKPGYQIIAGERRFRALQENGATRIPAIVRRVSDQEARELAIIENVNRADMRPLETARAYRGLRDSGMTPRQIATRLGKSEAHVQQHLDMLNLHPHVAQAVDEGRLHLGVVRDLAKLSHAGQQEAAERILRDDLGVRAGKALIKAVYGREHQGSLFEQRASLTKAEREAKGRYEDAIQKITAHLSRLDDETMGHMARAVDSPAREAERLKIMRAQLNKMQQLLENERAARDLGGVAASEYGAFRHYALDWIAQRQATIALAEPWDGETVQLFSFGPHFGRVTEGMRGAVGGVGEDANHTLYSAHGHHFAGRAKGEHNEANIHEHLAAQHHGEGQGAGGGRRLARPNEGAHRIQRDGEHVRAIRRVAAAHANPALHAEPRLRELRQEAETATEAAHQAGNDLFHLNTALNASIRGDLMAHPTARIRDLANRATRTAELKFGPKSQALAGRLKDINDQFIAKPHMGAEENQRLFTAAMRIREAQARRETAATKAMDRYRNAVDSEARFRLTNDPSYRQAMEHEARMDTARRNAVDAHAQLAQEYRLATNELFRAQQNLTSIQEHSRLTSARATHHDSNVRPFTQEQFVRALESPRYGNVNTGVNDTRLAKINGREYIIKHIIHLDSRGDAQAQVAREVVTPQVGRLLGVGENMPAATYHMSHAFEDYVVVSREAGRSVISHDPMVKSEIADHYDGIAGQKLLMFEYLVGQGDRHEGNILYNEHNNRLTEIDFGLEYPHGTALLERSVVGRALTHQGHIPMSQITIHPSVVEHALSVQHEVIRTLANGGVHSHDIDGVEHRFAVLHDLWQEYQNTGEMTMHDWWRIGGDHEGYHEAASPPWASAHQNWS